MTEDEHPLKMIALYYHVICLLAVETTCYYIVLKLYLDVAIK